MIESASTVSGWDHDVAVRAARIFTPDRLALRMDPKFVRFRHSVMMGNQFRRMMIGTDPWQIWTFQPQIGKSEIGSRRGPLWGLDRFPDQRIILGSYAVSLSQKSSRWVRNAIRDDRGRHLQVRLDPTRTTQAEFLTTEGGGVLAVGVGGSVTGNPADVVIVDDPHKNWFEANQPGQRDRVWDWWQGDITGRLQDEARGIIIMTRWHPDDLVGRLLDHGDAPNGKPWSVTHVPALADSTITPDGDPLGRADGEPVEPRRFKRTTMLQRRRVAGPFIWNALYQGVPRLAEGGILRRSWFGFAPAMPARQNVLAYITSWDCTFAETTDGSFVVGQAWAVTNDNPHRFVLYDQVRGRWDYPDTRAEFQRFASLHREASIHLIENAANGPALAAELRSLGVQGVTTIPARISKEARAIQISPLVADGRVDLPGWIDPGGWVEGFLTEVTDFPESGARDDQVDAFTQALAFLDRHAGTRGRQTIVDDERLFGRR